MRSIVAVVLTLVAATAAAQELGISSGAMDVVGTTDSSYAWSIEFRQHLMPHFEWSFAWLNEGHPQGHHRDGFTPQLWLTDDVFGDRVQVGVGAGPYRYFDTVPGPGGDTLDLNQWGTALSLYAGWKVSPRATLRLQTIRTYASRDIDTRLFLLGLGWRLRQSAAQLVQAAGSAPGEVVPRTVDREATVFGGEAILNDFHSPRSAAWGLQYRHGVGAHTDWTLSWINEGKTEHTDRDGLAAQIWAENGYSNERLLLGVGAGPYLYDDKERPETTDVGSRRGVAAVVSLSAGWRAGIFITRLTWNRVASFYNHDSDVIVLGIGLSSPGK